MRLWPLLAAATLVSAAALGQTAEKNPDLARGQKSFEELKYAEAAKSLDTAWATPGNDHQTVLKILELQAVVAATLGQQDRARVLFRALLYLAPEFKLPEGDLGPKVLSLYFEAKGRASVEGTLRLEVGPIARDQRNVYQLSVNVADIQRLGRRVRFHTRAPGGGWAARDAAVAEGPTVLDVEAPAIDWWAELVGDKDRVVGQLGSAGEPIVTRVNVLIPAERLQPVAVSSAPLNLRPVAYVVAGAGAAAAIVGLVFGIRANNQSHQILDAAKDADGRISGVTRARALELNGQQKTSATIANTMFVGAAALVGTGVALYFLSADVSVSGSPGGIAVGGSLP